jgi:hypothetical protein
MNLCFRAMIGTFDVVYGLSSFLSRLRGFINAGGGSTRRGKVVEWCRYRAYRG